MMRNLVSLLLIIIAMPLCAQLAAGETIPTGNDSETLAQLKQAVSDDRSDYRSWVDLGKAQARQNMLDEAIASLKSAMFLKTNFAEPHIEMARIYKNRNELAKAVRELEMAKGLDLEPGVSTEGLDDVYARLAVRTMPQPPELRALHERMADKSDADNSSDSQTTEQAAAEPEAVAPADPEQQALDAMEAWRKAWSGKDIDAYFAAYAVDFDPGDKYPSLAAWQNHKRKVIGRKAAIVVNIENTKPFPLPDGSIKVFFLQHYRSGAYTSDDMKMLWFKNSSEGWKIVQEVTN